MLALLALAGCTGIGESGVDAEFNRIQAERGFVVSSSGPKRVVFKARGKRIVVEPPQGYCLEPDAVKVTRGSAFALVSECLSDRQAQVVQDSGPGQAVAINLPRSFPGIMTVSVSGDPAFGAEPNSVDAFERLLRSEAGSKLLHRGNNGGDGTIVATRRAGQALYVLIDEAEGQSAFLSPQFWRGFIEINERLILVTVSCFSDRPIGADGMLAFLAAQMAQLRRANGISGDADEDSIAGQLALAFADAPVSGVEVVVSESGAETEDGIAPGHSPNPPTRYAAATRSGAKTASRAGAGVPMPPPRGARAAGPPPGGESSAIVVAKPRSTSSVAAVAAPISSSSAAPKAAPLAPKRRR